MTKYETEAYYSAIGRKGNLLILDSTDTEDTIAERILGKTTDGVDTISVEAFHNDSAVMALEVTYVGGKFDLYQDKECKLFGESLSTVANFIVSAMPKAAKSPYDRYVAERLPDGKYLVKSFKTDEESVIDPTDEARLLATDEFILGEYRSGNGGVEYHPITIGTHADKRSILSGLLDNIVNDRIKLFAKICINIIPDYVFEVPASNSSATRPASHIAEGGLFRHIVDSVNMMLTLTGRTYARVKYTQNEIDMMIVATMFHDFLHRGWQEDYERDGDVRFDHPRMAAKAIRCIRGILPMNATMFIANCIESHMGQKNSDPDDPGETPLPIPDTECKYLVHMANHLTAQYGIGIIRNDVVYAYDDQEIRLVPRVIPLTDADRIYIQNAMAYEIDPALARSLGIDQPPERIPEKWRKILAAGVATKPERAYVELAKRMTTF